MKTIKFNLFLFTTLIVLTSVFTACKKDYEASKPTFFPNIVINGSSYVAVPLGSTYTDAGATVTVNGAPLAYETVSDVDASTSGAYTVTYTAVNEDGFSVSQTRTVIVANPDALLDDLSGTYRRSSNTPASTWTKDPSRPYAYIVNNPGGVGNNPPFNVTFYVYNVEPGIVVVPLQQSGALAPFFATANSVGGDPQIPFNVSASVGQVAYTWYLNGPNFGPAARIFVKI